MGDGLLKRAQNKITEAEKAVEAAMTEDFAFDETSGISREDQKDILSHIEKIATSNRISSDPSVWKVKPRRNGVLMPMAVNLAAVAIIAGGLLILSSTFNRDKTAEQTGTAKLASAEGRLIQELKKETDVQLKAKDRELQEVQERLKNLDTEKSRIITDMEAKIKAKEAELAARLDYEIQKERERLIAQGYGSAEIQERLKLFEQQKKKEFDAVLDEFKKKTDIERKQMEENLQKMRDEYKASLGTLNAERQKLLEDSRAREQELRSALDERNKALEEARAKADAGLAAAKSDLAKLNDQLEKSKVAEDRLIGLYAGIRDALYDKRYDDAQAALVALKNYIDDPMVSELPNMQKRRAADLFVIDALGKYIDSEKARNAVDLTKLAESATLLATVRGYSDNATAELKKGNVAKAEELYALALSTIPELSTASDYFLARYRENETTLLASVEQAAKLVETSYDSGDYARTLTGFDQLLATLPLPAERRTALSERVRKAAETTATQARRTADTRNAGPALEQARKLEEQGRYEDAIGAFADVAARYPAADQFPDAIDGIRAGVRSLARTRVATNQESSAYLKEIDALTKALEAEKAKAADLAKANTELTKKNQELTKTNGDLTTRNAELQKTNVDLSRQLAAASSAQAGSAQAGTAPASSAELEAAKADAASARTELAGTKETLAKTTTERDDYKRRLAELEAKLGNIGVVAAKFETLTKNFAAYAKAEDAILAKGGSNAYVEARAKLDEFLGKPESAEPMPDLRARIKRYEQAFQQAGQQEVVLNFIGILEDLATIPSKDQRALFLDSKARAATDPSMKEFLRKLKDTL